MLAWVSCTRMHDNHIHAYVIKEAFAHAYTCYFAYTTSDTACMHAVPLLCKCVCVCARVHANTNLHATLTQGRHLFTHLHAYLCIIIAVVVARKTLVHVLAIHVPTAFKARIARTVGEIRRHRSARGVCRAIIRSFLAGPHGNAVEARCVCHVFGIF